MSSGRANVVLAISLLVAVGLSGVVAGVAIDRMWLLPPGGPGGPHMGPPGMRGLPFGPPRAPIERLRRELSLDDTQAAKIETILEEARRESMSIRERGHTEVEAIMERTRGRVSALLTPEQARKLESLELGPPRGPPGRHPGPPGHDDEDRPPPPPP